LGTLCAVMECGMRFRLRSLFVLILFAALASLLLRQILKPRLIVGEVTALSHRLYLIEVSIGANDSATVGQSVVVTCNGGSLETARIMRVSEDHALAKNSHWDKWTFRHMRKGDRVLLLPREPAR
jgi:hypothetical protein